MTSTSLRVRLTLIILIPLLLIGAAVGRWQVDEARRQAADLFDRSLLSTALAISADVARTGGDAISIETRDLLSDTAGGQVFYHVYAPDGVFVTGYATPPVPTADRPPVSPEIVYYNGRYRGRDVRTLRFQNVTTIDNFTGPFTFTVWQDVETRNALLRDLTRRSFVVIAVLIATVALVVWFGVSIGLRPLLDLEDAISRRSSDDLGPIQRAVPPEIRGLVKRLNLLFAQVAGTMEAQAVFISNAAHQLRNPVAGMLSLAEAVHAAPTPEAARHRAGDLLDAARQTGDLANKLLTLERASAGPGPMQRTDLVALAEEVAASVSSAQVGDVTLKVEAPATPVHVIGDPVMLREALLNLVDNALLHGGPSLTRVTVAPQYEDDTAVVRVSDDGVGIAPEHAETVMARFGQASPGEGSGLGLSIVEAVVERHGGSVALMPTGPGAVFELRLPRDGAP